MQHKTLLVGVSIFVGLLALTAFLYLTSKPSFRGAVITPPWSAPEINLTDHNGRPFKMSDQHGRVVLLYFGYVNCPDECPLTMAHLKLALESLGDRARDVQVIMVSTDPVRDTPQALKDFMEHFNPLFLGLTVNSPRTSESLERLWCHCRSRWRDPLYIPLCNRPCWKCPRNVPAGHGTNGYCRRHRLVSKRKIEYDLFASSNKL